MSCRSLHSQGAIYDRPIAGFTCSDKYCNSPAASLGVRRLIKRVFSRCLLQSSWRGWTKVLVGNKSFIYANGAAFAVPLLLLLLLVGVCVCVGLSDITISRDISHSAHSSPCTNWTTGAHLSINVAVGTGVKVATGTGAGTDAISQAVLMANKVCTEFSAFSFLFSVFRFRFFSSHNVPLSATCWAVSCFAYSLLLLLSLSLCLSVAGAVNRHRQHE